MCENHDNKPEQETNSCEGCGGGCGNKESCEDPFEGMTRPERIGLIIDVAESIGWHISIPALMFDENADEESIDGLIVGEPDFVDFVLNPLMETDEEDDEGYEDLEDDEEDK